MKCKRFLSCLLTLAILVAGFTFPVASASSARAINQLPNYITTLDSDTTVAECLAQLAISSGTVEVQKNNGTILEDDDIIGTGTVIRIVYTDYTVENATIVIAGDVDGDGYATASDYVQVRRSILGLYSLNAAQAAAADANGDGSVDGTDYVFYRRYILGLSSIWSVVISNDNNNDESADIPEGFEFRSNVINLADDDGWNVSNGTATVPLGTDVPAVGDIITFGTEYAIKVDSVRQAGVRSVITYSTPELYEFLESIDIEGTAQLDLSQFQPAPGVRVRSSSNIALDIDINSDGISASGEIPLEDPYTLNVGLEFDKPDVDYKFDVGFGNPFLGQDLINVRDAMISLQTGMDVQVGLGASTDGEVDDFVEFEVPLGSIPIVGIPGFCAEVEVDLNFEAGGEVYVTFGFSGLLGARIVNNRYKNICDLHPTLSAGLAGEAKVYGEIELDAEVFGEDIFSLGGQMGVAGEGAVDFRDTGMVCMDAVVYPFVSLTAFDDTLIEDWLDLSVNVQLMHSGNAPIKWDVHFEDMVKVDECTWDKGTIMGTVANADNRTQYISGAKIEIEGADAPFYSDANGRYTAKVDTGSLRIRISADGYIPFESLETVLAGEIVYLETYLMVEGDEDENATGTIGGRVTNAVTGSNISGVELSVRKGWNTTSGTVVATTQTNSSGRYTLTLPLGNYTISMKRDGYVSSHINVAVTKMGNNNCHATLNPDGSSVELGDLRVVLTWGATPDDLDSHLWGPSNDYHIYYRDMSHYENGDRVAYLDRDDITSYGPETTTVYDMQAVGKYNFFVHDYTNRYSTGSSAMANSGAKVRVYMGEQLIAEYNVPTSGSGNVWHVFTFDAETGTIRGVNSWANITDPDYVGASSSRDVRTTYDGLKDYEIEATEEPVVEEPTVEEPAEEPVVEEPAEEPVVEEPTVEEPAEEPTVEEPAEEPTVEEPAEEPTVEEPAEEPTVEEPAEEPVVEEPAEEPVVEEPVEEPVVEEAAEEPIVEEAAEEPIVEEPAEA